MTGERSTIFWHQSNLGDRDTLHTQPTFSNKTHAFKIFKGACLFCTQGVIIRLIYIYIEKKWSITRNSYSNTIRARAHTHSHSRTHARSHATKGFLHDAIKQQRERDPTHDNFLALRLKTTSPGIVNTAIYRYRLGLMSSPSRRKHQTWGRCAQALGSVGCTF